MGVLTSAGVKKYDLLSDTADITALKAGIRELNTQETLVWTEMKLPLLSINLFFQLIRDLLVMCFQIKS